MLWFASDGPPRGGAFLFVGQDKGPSIGKGRDGKPSVERESCGGSSALLTGSSPEYQSLEGLQNRS